MSVPAAQSQVSLGEKVAIAVRPEKLRITDEPPAGGYNGPRGKLIAESYAGDCSHYFLDVAGLSRRVSVASLNELPSSTRPGIDGAEEVWVVWPIESGLLLTS